jgi:hypothetical protein
VLIDTIKEAVEDKIGGTPEPTTMESAVPDSNDNVLYLGQKPSPTGGRYVWHKQTHFVYSL